MCICSTRVLQCVFCCGTSPVQYSLGSRGLFRKVISEKDRNFLVLLPDIDWKTSCSAAAANTVFLSSGEDVVGGSAPACVLLGAEVRAHVLGCHQGRPAPGLRQQPDAAQLRHGCDRRGRRRRPGGVCSWVRKDKSEFE